MEEFEEKWEKSQIAVWRNDEDKIILFFKRFNIDVKDLYRHVTKIDYDRMQIICYLLSKIDKAIKICDFLDTLARDNNEDVDIIKIYILISHAEITSQSFKKTGRKIDLVKKYFETVKESLKYKIIPNFLPDREIPAMDFTDILYKIRCDYTHEGNYTGRIFKNDNDGADSILFHFKNGGLELFGQCGITYKKFMNIYMIALIENIKVFSEYSKK